MVISRTPYRISFLGGGTDYPAWYEHHGGAVLATSINRYCYISCRYLPQFFEHRHRIVYSEIECVRNVDEIRHPAVRESLRFMDLTRGLEIHHDGDLPKQTGLGTSSSFCVGLLNALYAIEGKIRAPMQLARDAIHVERDLCGDNVGSQDQVTAAFGGFNHIEFTSGNVISVKPITLPASRLRAFQSHLMLFFTGFSRRASAIAADQIRNIPGKKMEMKTIQGMVEQGLDILTSGRDLLDFGRLLREGWQLKRGLSKSISNDDIDSIYNRGLKAGAVGGKLCGAGGGGFLLFFIEPDRHPALRKELEGFLEVPFEFDYSGTQIIFYQPDGLSEQEGG